MDFVPRKATPPPGAGVGIGFVPWKATPPPGAGVGIGFVPWKATPPPGAGVGIGFVPWKATPPPGAGVGIGFVPWKATPPPGAGVGIGFVPWKANSWGPVLETWPIATAAIAANAMASRPAEFLIFMMFPPLSSNGAQNCMLKVVTRVGQVSSGQDPLGWQRKMEITVKLTPRMATNHPSSGSSEPAA